MIQLLIDIYGMVSKAKGERTLALQKYTDYPDARQKIHRAIHDKKDLTVYITDPVSSKWFWDLEEYPGVKIEEYDPCNELKKKLNLDSLPTGLAGYPEIILELALLSRPTPKESPKSVWNWVLSETLGECWGEEVPSWQHFTALANWFLQGQDEKAPSAEIFEERKKKQIEQWLCRASGKMHSAYAWFLKTPTIKAEILLIAQVLKNYPEDLQREWLTHIFPKLDSPSYELIVSIPPLWRNKDILNKIDKEVQIYWHGQMEEDINFRKMLNEMSGKILGELDALSNWFKKYPKKAFLEYIDLIRLKFDDLEEAPKHCDELLALVPPSYPQKPDVNWSWDKWAQWVINEYFPYRSWLWKHKEADSRIDRFASLFCDWLYGNYPKFIHGLKPLVYGTFSQIKELVTNGYVVFWILIDNLSWNLTGDLLKMLKEQEICPTKEAVCQIAMLPSETHISKSSILAGRIPSQIQEVDPSSLFCDYWKKEQGINVRMEANTPTLDGLFSQPAQIYLYEYTKLDYIAHEPDHRVVDREQAVQEASSWLVKQVGKAIKKLPDLDKVRVVISTDHGSTYIAKSGKNLRVPLGAEEDVSSKKHKRFVKITKKEGLDKVDWYLLKADEFGLKCDYAVTKGYSYLQSRPQGYTHGGLTPEETVIPYLELSISKPPQLQPINIVHRGDKILRGRPQELTLTVKNPNSFPVSDFTLRLPKYMVKIGIPCNASIEPVSEKDTENFSIALGPKLPIREGSATLKGVCSYRIFGEKRDAERVVIKIRVREIFRITEDFEDLF